MNTLIKFIAAILFSTLMVVNFSVVYEFSPFSVQADVEMNEANARSLEEDYRMTQERCWATGDMIDICRYDPGMLCESSYQDTCSSSDPIEN